MVDYSNFDFGWRSLPTTKTLTINGDVYNFNEFAKKTIVEEIFQNKEYETFTEVQEGDVVLDVGASCGPFTYSILDKNPSKVVCVEPNPIEHPVLEKNVSGENVHIQKSLIGPTDGHISTGAVLGGPQSTYPSITFKSLIEKYNLEKIDFLKTDCEGGEYDIFTIDNFCWLKENLGVAVGEWHLSTPELREKFREFRDVFLRLFPNHQVLGLCGTDIKWELWTEKFLNYYTEVIIYIDNRK